MKATIVIPNINGKGWLKDSIESVYAQTEQDFAIRALPGPGASLWCSSTMMPLPSPGGWQN